MTANEIAGQLLRQALGNNGPAMSTEAIEMVLTGAQLAWITNAAAQDRKYFRDSVDSVPGNRAVVKGRSVADYEIKGGTITFTPISFLGTVRPIIL